MIMPDDEAIVAEKTNAPAEMTSRRQAIGVMGTAAAAGMATMPAFGAPAPTGGAASPAEFAGSPSAAARNNHG
jgi:hypothetical protein